MNRVVRTALLLVSLVCAAPLAAQGPGAPGLPDERRPFELFHRERDALELTDAQLGRLAEIRASLEAENAPLRLRLREMWRAEQARRRQRLERMPARERREALHVWRRDAAAGRVPAPMRPLLAEMRVNIRRATTEAEQVLTGEQKARARALVGERMRERRPGERRAGERGAPRRVPPGAPGP